MIAALRTSCKTALETHLPWTLHRLRVVRHIYLRTYESEIELVSALVTPGTDAVDVGANTGLFSWQISRFARTCTCFEPQPNLAAYLKRALPGNCVVIAAAAGDARGTAEIQLPWFGNRFDEGLASINATKVAQFEKSKSIKVPVETLDDIVKTDVSFLNIDVEGHEVHTLRGGLGLLKAKRPKVLVEIEARHNPQSFGLVTALFRDIGYSGYFCRERTLKTLEGFDQRRHQNLNDVGTPAYINNFLFLPDEAPKPVF